VRNRTQQLVLVLGAMLCFGNGSPLLAGVISRVDTFEPRPLPGIPTYPVAPGQTPSAREDANQASAHQGPKKPFAKQPSSEDESAALHARGPSVVASHSPSTGEFKGLVGASDSMPMPLPSPTPDRSGNADGMGVVPTTSSRDLPDAVLAYSSIPIQEQTSVLGLPSFRVVSDPGSTGLFRPPR
jgi:hypothetical protein